MGGISRRTAGNAKRGRMMADGYRGKLSVDILAFREEMVLGVDYRYLVVWGAERKVEEWLRKDRMEGLDERRTWSMRD